jgi:hypothetical protein
VLIAGAERIAVVGIAVRVSDIHIWDALSRAKAEIYYCSGKSAKPSFEAWAAKNRPAGSKDVTSEKFWADDFESVADHLGYLP